MVVFGLVIKFLLMVELINPLRSFFRDPERRSEDVCPAVVLPVNFNLHSSGTWAACKAVTSLMTQYGLPTIYGPVLLLGPDPFPAEYALRAPQCPARHVRSLTLRNIVLLRIYLKLNQSKQINQSYQDPHKI